MAAAKEGCCVRLDSLPKQVTADDVRGLLSGLAVEEVKLQPGGADDAVAYVRLRDEESKAAVMQNHELALEANRSLRVFEVDSIPSTTPSNPDHPDDCSFEGGHSSHAVVRVRGLPFNTTVEQVASLLHDVALADDGPPIVLARLPDGRPTGDAYVRVASEEALTSALCHDNHKLGTRYVQVFRASMRDLHEATGCSNTSSSTLTRSSSSSGDVATVLPHHMLGATNSNATTHAAAGKKAPTARTPVRGQGRGSPGGSSGRGRGGGSPADAPQTGPIVELRGLPFMATVDDIVAFFQGFDVTPQDVTLPMRRDLRTGMAVNTGYAHVVFSNRDVAARARQARHCKMMGNRYIECLPPSHHMVLPRQRPDEWRGPGGPHSWPGPYMMMGPGSPRMPGPPPPMQQAMMHDMTPEQQAAMMKHGGYSQAPMYYVPQPHPPGSQAPMPWPPASGGMHVVPGPFPPGGDGQGPAWMGPHPGSPYAMPYMMAHHYFGRPSPPRPAEGPPGPSPPEAPPPSPKAAAAATPAPAPSTPQLQRAGASAPSDDGAAPVRPVADDD